MRLIGARSTEKSVATVWGSKPRPNPRRRRRRAANPRHLRLFGTSAHSPGSGWQLWCDCACEAMWDGRRALCGTHGGAGACVGHVAGVRRSRHQSAFSAPGRIAQCEWQRG